MQFLEGDFSDERGYGQLPEISKTAPLKKMLGFKQKVRHEAAQEMRGGPSKPACRSWLQTTLSCDGKESLW